MKKIILSIIKRFHSGFKKGVSEYSKEIKKYDPGLTFGIFGFLGNIASGLFNGVRGAIGGFFGGGGAVTVAGPPAPPVTVLPPPPPPAPLKKDNTLLYVGIAAGVVIFVVVIIMLTGRK